MVTLKISEKWKKNALITYILEQKTEIKMAASPNTSKALVFPNLYCK